MYMVILLMFSYISIKKKLSHKVCPLKIKANILTYLLDGLITFKFLNWNF